MGIGFKRNARVGQLIMKEVANMLLRGEIRDPRLNDLVITGFKMSEDIGFARIYYTTLNKERSIDDINKGFEKAKGYIKSRLSKSLRLKKFPDIRFEFDKSLEQGYKVDQLIKDSIGE